MKVFITTFFLILCFSTLIYSSAEYFNQLASNKEFKPDEVIQALEIKSHYHIADIGAGGGYYVYRFAKIVNNGKVYAIDVNPDYLKYIRKTIKKLNIKNVEVLKADNDDPKLKKGSVDLIFLRTVYHHIEDRVHYFKKIKESLKPNGRIAVIDNLPSKGGEDFITKYGHYSLKETILSEMERAGYNLVKEHRFIPKQSFFIFKRKK